MAQISNSGLEEQGNVSDSFVSRRELVKGLAAGAFLLMTTGLVVAQTPTSENSEEKTIQFFTEMSQWLNDPESAAVHVEGLEDLALTINSLLDPQKIVEYLNTIGFSEIDPNVSFSINDTFQEGLATLGLSVTYGEQTLSSLNPMQGDAHFQKMMILKSILNKVDINLNPVLVDNDERFLCFIKELFVLAFNKNALGSFNVNNVAQLYLDYLYHSTGLTLDPKDISYADVFFSSTNYQIALDVNNVPMPVNLIILDLVSYQPIILPYLNSVEVDGKEFPNFESTLVPNASKKLVEEGLVVKDKETGYYIWNPETNLDAQLKRLFEIGFESGSVGASVK
jgi:ABC-type transport system substrate-binding protein